MKFKISYFTLMLYLSLLLSGDRSLLMTMFSALLHELGHLCAAAMRGIRVSEMNITVTGARIKLVGLYSYSDEIIVSLFGPLVNLLSVVVVNSIFNGFIVNYDVYVFVASSLTLAITNLFPIKSFDGGRILNALLLKHLSVRVSDIILTITSTASLFLIWTISVYFLLKNASSLSLFVFSISIFLDIFMFKKQ